VTDEHPVEALVEYALGSLEAAERANVEAHVAACAACAARLRGYQGVVATLPLGLAPVSPPSEALETIKALARGRRADRKARPKPVFLAGWLRLARWPAVAAALALLLFWNVTLQRELVRRAPGPAPGPEVEALSRRPGRVVILNGTGKPNASARLFVAVDGGGHLAVSGLEPLPPRERTYQLWFVPAGGLPVTGAAFGVDGYGRAWVKVAVPSSLDDVQAIVITEEPAPRGSAPTGQHLLEALPWK
jgi:anti-sigma-K factor RskA